MLRNMGVSLGTISFYLYGYTRLSGLEERLSLKYFWMLNIDEMKYFDNNLQANLQRIRAGTQMAPPAPGIGPGYQQNHMFGPP